MGNLVIVERKHEKSTVSMKVTPTYLYVTAWDSLGEGPTRQTLKIHADATKRFGTLPKTCFMGYCLCAQIPLKCDAANSVICGIRGKEQLEGRSARSDWRYMTRDPT